MKFLNLLNKSAHYFEIFFCFLSMSHHVSCLISFVHFTSGMLMNWGIETHSQLLFPDWFTSPWPEKEATLFCFASGYQFSLSWGFACFDLIIKSDLSLIIVNLIVILVHTQRKNQKKAEHQWYYWCMHHLFLSHALSPSCSLFCSLYIPSLPFLFKTKGERNLMTKKTNGPVEAKNKNKATRIFSFPRFSIEVTAPPRKESGTREDAKHIWKSSCSWSTKSCNSVQRWETAIPS